MKYANEQLKRAADTIRCLSADMIEQANSGHPGAALGMADLAVSLWMKYLNVDPKDPTWAGRDRLVFSGGHASALVYSLFHLSGMGGLTMDEVKNFRQFGSRTAGHPERGLMPGVEVTTGPLGQGIAMGVGMALAARKEALAAGRASATAPRVWVFCGDGDLEEGISHEACSFAGFLGLDNLVLIYDSNRITIEGSTGLAMADDAKKRFQSYGWQVLECDGHDYNAIDKTYRKALKAKGKPVFILATTHIGFGAPTKVDTADSHGAPLGAEEVAGLKKNLGFDPEQSFFVPQEVYDLFAARTAQCHRLRNKWMRTCAAAEAPKCDTAALVAALPTFDLAKPVATRAACGSVMNALAPLVPSLIGGSADLGPSNKTVLKGLSDVKPGDFSGRNIHFGIRELAMTAIVNGITAYGGYRGYGATFFVFADYCRPAIRLGALMGLPSLFVFSHDSFYVGEDGPTHEPVEQLAAMRLVPNLTVWRPADANETAHVWIEMLKHEKGPSCILTTRQNVPVLSGVTAEGVAKGGYVIFSNGDPEIVFIASGSEVALCVAAAEKLAAEGRYVRVVSMPCRERFLAQPESYRNTVIPPACTARVIVEAGVKAGWESFAAGANRTRYLTLERYGASGPYKVLAEKFGFTVDAVYAHAKELI